MILKRCIMIFPEFENAQIIDKIRQRYDPNANIVRPHITLVFPFESDISTDDLKEHISSAVSGTTPFELILNGIKPVDSFGKYLFLNVLKGGNEITELHRRLYTGVLGNHYPESLKGNVLIPHMTVGSFDNDYDFKRAINETKSIDDTFKTIANEICTEIIYENEGSKIEFIIPFE